MNNGKVKRGSQQQITFGKRYLLLRPATKILIPWGIKIFGFSFFINKQIKRVFMGLAHIIYKKLVNVNTIKKYRINDTINMD